MTKPLSAEDALRPGTCPHDHIRHETKSRTVCKGCGVEMLRHRGSWIGRGDDPRGA